MMYYGLRSKQSSEDMFWNSTMYNPIDRFFGNSVVILPVWFIWIWLMSIMFFRRNSRFWKYMVLGCGFSLLSSMGMKTVFTIGCQMLSLDICNRPNGFDMYGMPSGHMQLAVFSTFFPYIVYLNEILLIISICFTFYMAYTRIVVFHMHTLLQVVIGWGFGMYQSLLTGNLYLER